MAPEITEGGIVGQTRVMNGHSLFNSSHISRRVKMLLNSFKLWSSEGATRKIFRLWYAAFPQKHEVSTKKISVKFCTCSVYSLTFSMQYNFLTSTFVLVGQRILLSKLCKFSGLMAVICSPSNIVNSASSVLLVSGVFVNKKRNPQHPQALLRLQLVLLSSSRNSCMRAAQFHQISHRYHLGQYFCFQYSQSSCEHLITNLKLIQNFTTGGKTLQSAIKIFLFGN